LRIPTARQLYLGGLIWKPVSVDRIGQVLVNGWGYGDPVTQENLLPYRKGGAKNPKGGVKINFGRDPDDFSAPAMAYDLNGKLICGNIAPFKRGAYGSVDGIRDAAHKRKAAKVDIKAAGRANNYLDDAAYNRAMAALDFAIDTEDSPMPPSQKVVGARFGIPLQDNPPLENESAQAAIPEEFRQNMDIALAAKRLLGGKLA